MKEAREQKVGATHPLRQLFTGLVQKHYFEDVPVRDVAVTRYVADLLVEFAETDRLYRLRNSGGRRLENLTEMVAASNPLGEAESFDRERAVRKHIGDFTLFFTGLYPEYVTSYRRRWKPAADAFADYMKAGKESYHIVSCFDQFEYRAEAPLFRLLSEKFEMCVYGLHLVRQDLEREQRDLTRRLERLLNRKPIA